METVKSYFIAEWDLTYYSNEFIYDYKKNIIITMKSYDKDHKLVKTNKIEIVKDSLKGKYEKEKLKRWMKFIKDNYNVIREAVAEKIKLKIDEMKKIYDSIPYTCS